MRAPFRTLLLAALPLTTFGGCGDPTPAPAAAPAAPPPITNRIPLPPEVVANLGITFEKARRGRLETRLRVPGRVEIAPEARYVVRAPSGGRVAMRAARWQKVTRGEVVAELLAPDLRTAQEALADAEAAVARTDLELVRTRAEGPPLAEVARATDAALTAAREREVVARESLANARELERAARERIASMQKLTTDGGLATGVVFAARQDHVEAQAAVLDAAHRWDEARNAIAALGLELARARVRAETAGGETTILERRKATLEGSVRQQLRSLAVLTGVPVEQLTATAADGPTWARLEAVPIRAPADGLVVEVLASDAEWVEASGPLLRIVDPTRMVFRGELPEADVARIPPNAEVRIEVGCTDCAKLETNLGAARPLADPRTRTVLVEARLPGDASAFPDGSSATAAVLLDRSPSEETLIPTACVVQDELELLIFRRDPANPDQVIRTVASLGRRSDGWVEVLAEIAEGDEVVRDGVHQLRLTGSGKAPANGHFHADGTWHEGKD